MTTLPYRLTSTVAVLLSLAACAVEPPAPKVSIDVAPQWHAPLPHQGALTDLAQWWQRQGDPVLVALMASAQAASPTVAQALSRIESARAAQVAAGAVLLPNISASAGISRGVSLPNVPIASTTQVGIQAAWELDLVGANRVASSAAQAQLDGTQAQWHDARVLVAAEVANLYFGLAACQPLLALARQEADSTLQTARLTGISAKAGLTASAVAALAQSSAAQARSSATEQAAQCDVQVKALVALTATPEPDLRQKIAQAHVSSALIAPFSIASLPAQSIAQRPDVFAAERDVVVASAQVGSAQAQRYPRLTLNGSIGALRYGQQGVNTDISTWSFGPLALSLPLFDGGQRQANQALAQAHYVEAVAIYRDKVRQAVREVEEALVNLHSAQSRQTDAQSVTQGYAQSQAAVLALHAQGLANALELEDARRMHLAAQANQIALQLACNRAWIALYRAVGGGGEPTTATFTAK